MNQKNILLPILNNTTKCNLVNLSPGSWYQGVKQTLNFSGYFLSNLCDFWYAALFYIFVQYIFFKTRKPKKKLSFS